MSALTPSLLESILSQPLDAEHGASPLVPLKGEALFHELVAGVLRFMATDPGTAGTVLMDGCTAHALAPDLTPNLAAMELRIHSGALPAWCAKYRAEAWQADELGYERFCVASSGACQVALVGEPRGNVLHGAWTTHGDTVGLLALRLVATMEEAPVWPPAGPLPLAGEHLALHLMRMQVLHQEGRAPDAREHADLHSVLAILKAISGQRRSSDILYVFAEGVARAVPMERCSVVRVWADRRVGHVLASHEDERVQDLNIDLERYPEIRQVLQTGRTVVIDSVQDDPLMAPVRAQLAEASITSVVVAPVVMDDPEVGTLLLRAARHARPFTRDEVGFFEIVAQAASNALERAHLLENLQSANEHLERLATTDGLTGLHNHRYFIERLESEVQRAKRYGVPLACIFIDIDNFKAFNDRHGHLVGDAVLREAAQRIAKVMRKVDTVARYGGEEFTLILPQTDADGAASKAEMIRALIADKPFACVRDGQRVTVSVGVGLYCRDAMEDHLALCRTADRALYISKRNGKNQVTLGGANP